MSGVQKPFEAFSLSAEKAAMAIREVAEKDGMIHVFSHLDADGVAAAGVISKALLRLGARFRVKVTQWVDEKIIGEIAATKPDLVALADFGSGYLSLLNEKAPDQRFVILDHHQISVAVDSRNIVHVNPHLHGLDGATEVSGAGVSYFAMKALSKENVDLSPVAVVGALGDMQDKYDQRKLGGLNERIVEDAVAAGLLVVEKDLTFFGRETRPIHKALASSSSPFVPGISGDESASVALLDHLGIRLREGDKWRALRDLTLEEKRALCSALAEHLLSRGLHLEVASLIGNIYVLAKEQPSTSLRDAREFGVLLNSAGRLDRPSLGIAVCMGERGAALDEANLVLDNYRKDINRYLNWVMEKPERMREFENVFVVYGESAVNEKVIGTVASILAYNLMSEKAILAFAHVPEEGVAKFSARTTEAAVQKGMNLGEVMRVASEKSGGKGGGHNIAAGSQVPLDQIESFIKLADQLVGKQLRGEGFGSNDKA
jgi:RecJ-like exonuclease